MDKYIPIDHPWADSSEAPIYEVAFPPSTTDEALRSYFEVIGAWSCRVSYAVIWVIDMTRVERVTASQRALYAGFLQRMHAFDLQYTHAIVLVLPNGMLRGIVTAVFWLHPPPYSHHTCASSRDGRSWARDKRLELGADR
jgi:hypothetical protein